MSLKSLALLIISLYLIKFCNNDGCKGTLSQNLKCSSIALNEKEINLGFKKCCSVSYTIEEDQNPEKHCLEFIEIKNFIDERKKVERRCTKCEEGYSLTIDNKYCYNTIPHCKTYYLSQKECHQCENGYNLSIDKEHCYNTIYFCNIYSSDGKNCLQCGLNYLITLTYDHKECVETNIGACKEYSNKERTECKECWSYHYLESPNSCIGYDLRCVYYNSRTSCRQCYPTYLADEFGQCVKPIENCNTYSPENKNCNNCIEGYALTPDGLKCLRTVIGCGKYLDNEGKYCERCVRYPIETLNIEKNMCLSSIDNCKEYIDYYHCNICFKGYTLSDDKSECLSSIENCINDYDDYYGTTKCQRCKSGYLLNKNETKCILKIIDNCEQFEDDEGKFCLKCRSSYYPSIDHSVCLDVINFCILYTDNEGKQCEKCDKYFELSEDKTKCEYSGIKRMLYENNNLMCYPKISNKDEDIEKAIENFKKDYPNYIFQKIECSSDDEKENENESNYIGNKLIIIIMILGLLF